MSWDRSRSIPWSRISQEPGVDPYAHRERVFREMQREAQQQQQEQTSTSSSSSQNEATVDGSTKQDTDGSVIKKNNGVEFSGMDMLKQAAFGGVIGAITGSVFGFMDGMRTAGESKVLQNASNMAKGRYILQGTTRSATMFGAFFGGFHVMKYGVRVVADPGEYTEIAIAAPVILGGLMTQPAFRPLMPYASMLILMDGIHIFMRNMDDD